MDLIVGGGTYGKLAFDKIRDDGGCIVVIDEDPGCIVQEEYGLPEVPGECILQEGEFFIKGGIETAAGVFTGNTATPGDSKKYMDGRIFPTAPVHILAGIISEICGFVPDPEGAETAACLIPEDLIAGRKGADIYCSFNRYEPCLPRCPSPEICPVTGERRDVPLWEILGSCLPSSFVIESRQLSPGLGYIECSDLAGAVESARSEDRILVGTACKCHGVITALEKIQS